MADDVDRLTREGREHPVWAIVGGLLAGVLYLIGAWFG